MKRVEVHWRDAVSDGQGWASRDDYLKGVPVCRTVGWLVEDAPDFIAVALSWDPENSNINGMQIIPRENILLVRGLRRAS